MMYIHKNPIVIHFALLDKEHYPASNQRPPTTAANQNTANEHKILSRTSSIASVNPQAQVTSQKYSNNNHTTNEQEKPHQQSPEPRYKENEDTNSQLYNESYPQAQAENYDQQYAQPQQQEYYDNTQYDPNQQYSTEPYGDQQYQDQQYTDRSYAEQDQSQYDQYSADPNQQYSGDEAYQQQYDQQYTADSQYSEEQKPIEPNVEQEQQPQET